MEIGTGYEASIHGSHIMIRSHLDFTDVFELVVCTGTGR